MAVYDVPEGEGSGLSQEVINQIQPVWDDVLS